MKIDRETAKRRIQTIIDAYDQIHAIAKAIGAQPESPMLTAFDDVARIAIAATEQQFMGKDSDWIEWFLWENASGKNGMVAGYDNKTQPIRTIDDLLDLMEEGVAR